MQKAYASILIILITVVILHWPVTVRETQSLNNDIYISWSYEFNTSVGTYLGLKLKYYLSAPDDSGEYIRLIPIPHKTIEIIDI